MHNRTIDKPLLQSLGYIGVKTERLEEWSAFAKDLLGMQVDRPSKQRISIRVDDNAQRLFIDDDRDENVSVMGWEVADADTLARLTVKLLDAGHKVCLETSVIAEQRRVCELISTKDPLGNRLEFFYEPEKSTSAFVPGRALSGFRTGQLGLGHAVLTVENIDAVLPFYTDLLGFRLSDYALRPFKAFFFHLNNRHHSLALIETGVNGFHHLMVELNSLDDVGQAYDLAHLEENRIGVTLGRHTNDYMTSFYARTPSGFMIEYGWGGRSIDPDSWQPFECDYGPSLWGHERSWLSPNKKAEALQLRLDAAAQGQRAPDFVLGKS